jgi:hypothetical protein
MNKRKSDIKKSEFVSRVENEGGTTRFHDGGIMVFGPGEIGQRDVFVVTGTSRGDDWVVDYLPGDGGDRQTDHCSFKKECYSLILSEMDLTGVPDQ